jgi:hypothetical protein
VTKEGDKYQVKSLYNFIHNIILAKGKDTKEQREIEKYWYKPYELRKITPQQALVHLNSPLIRAYLYRIYENPDAIEDMRKYILKYYLS